MIHDDVIQQVRAAREAYAQLHNFDVQAMVADLRALDAAGDWPVVRRAPRLPRLAAPREVAPQEQPRQQTGAA
jgi:hypothetical protein